MANTIPLRLAIQIAITEALKEITVANGYSRDVKLVVRGENKLSADALTPSIAILEAPQQPDIITRPSEQSNLGFGQWQLLLKGDVEDDKTHPTDEAHYVMADVKKCLGKQRERRTHPSAQHGERDILGLGPIITEMDFSAGIVRPSEENISPNSFFWLIITLRFIEDNSDPYKYGRD